MCACMNASGRPLLTLDMAEQASSVNGPKRCFVTIGATASFSSLIRRVLEPEFIDELQRAGYTELRVQYGDHEGEKIFQAKTKELREARALDRFEITGFGFNKAGLREEMIAVKGQSIDTEGMVISHAGSGSILDGLRVGVPLVIVPNTELLHNHQVELAEVLAEQQYVVYGKLDNLSAAIGEVETLRRNMRKWPPLRSGEVKYKNGLADVMAEEMGWQLD
ncbi:UDP-N-acetylglucosamine transferase subunit alg13 [Exophiala dermatitidis]